MDSGCWMFGEGILGVELKTLPWIPWNEIWRNGTLFCSPCFARFPIYEALGDIFWCGSGCASLVGILGLGEAMRSELNWVSRHGFNWIQLNLSNPFTSFYYINGDMFPKQLKISKNHKAFAFAGYLRGAMMNSELFLVVMESSKTDRVSGFRRQMGPPVLDSVQLGFT